MRGLGPPARTEGPRTLAVRGQFLPRAPGACGFTKAVCARCVALPDNAFEDFFVAAVFVLLAFLVVLILRRGPPPGKAELTVDAGNGFHRSGLHLRIVNIGGRLTAINDVLLSSGGRSTSIAGLGTVLRLPRDLLVGESIEMRVSPRELLLALERLRLERPRFRVELAVFGGTTVVSEDLEVPLAWHHQLSPARRSQPGHETR